METNEKFLGRKIGLKNVGWKMVKTEIVGGKILGWKINIKNSNRLVGGKNWNSQ